MAQVGKQHHLVTNICIIRNFQKGSVFTVDTYNLPTNKAQNPKPCVSDNYLLPSLTFNSRLGVKGITLNIFEPCCLYQVLH